MYNIYLCIYIFKNMYFLFTVLYISQCYFLNSAWGMKLLPWGCHYLECLFQSRWHSLVSISFLGIGFFGCRSISKSFLLSWDNSSQKTNLPSSCRVCICGRLVPPYLWQCDHSGLCKSFRLVGYASSSRFRPRAATTGGPTLGCKSIQ